jgi:hypothetical protein
MDASPAPGLVIGFNPEAPPISIPYRAVPSVLQTLAGQKRGFSFASILHDFNPVKLAAETVGEVANTGFEIARNGVDLVHQIKDKPVAQQQPAPVKRRELSQGTARRRALSLFGGSRTAKKVSKTAYKAGPIASTKENSGRRKGKGRLAKLLQKDTSNSIAGMAPISSADASKNSVEEQQRLLSMLQPQRPASNIPVTPVQPVY